MKALPALLTALTLLAPAVLPAQEPTAAAPAIEAPAGDLPVAEEPPASTSTEVPAAPATPETPATPAPVPDVSPAMPSAADRPVDLLPSPDLTPAPEPALIPETPASTAKPPGSAIDQPRTEAEKKSKTEAAADALALKIRFREVQTRASKDPAVLAEWDQAERAPTDYEKREALKRYYKLLYGRMAKIDASLKPQIEIRRASSLGRLNQDRIDPTEPPVRATHQERAPRSQRVSTR